MTAYTDFARVAVAVLELDLDKCTRTFGVSPCVAGRKNSGTAQAGASSTITLAAGASAVDDAYNNMTVRITGGTGSGQERKISDYVGATKVATVSVAWTTTPDATSTYDVIDRPNACYNTFETCQDKTNYAKTTQTLRFCSEGAPLPAGIAMRPYVSQIATAPTVIELNQGLARRATSSITLRDEPDGDTETDPYITDRGTAAQGTFWTRLLARSPNYVGRFARIRRGYAATPWDWAQFVDELYIIDSIKGPSQSGTVSVVLKDILKLADRTQMPKPTDGKLTVAMIATDLSLTLDSGKGAQYDATGYVILKDEIIEYTGKAGDVLSWPSTAYRGKFGTTAMTHKVDETVQLCKAFIDQKVTDVLKSVLNEAGISNSYIDTALMTSEDDTWLGTKYHITAILTKPNEANRYIKELCFESNSVLWWSPVDQKVKFRVIMPRLSTGIPALTEAANLIEDSVSVESMDDQRLTYSGMKYGLIDYSKTRDEAANFALGNIYIDGDAESANQYNDRRSENTFSQWLSSPNAVAARAWVARRVGYYRNAPRKLKFKLDPKDDTFAVGDLVDITTAKLTDAAGAPLKTRVLVLRKDKKGTHLDIEAMTTKFGRRYAFINDNGVPNYPSATAAQRDKAFICNASGKMSNGDDGYIIC